MVKRNTFSFSEGSTLAHCEVRHHFRYEQGLDDEGNAGMWKGTLFHAFLARWWAGEFYGVDPASISQVDLFGAEALQEGFLVLPYQDLDDTEWLARRYLDHYGLAAVGFELVANEVKLSFILPGTRTRIAGKVDQVVRDPHGGLWAVEDKTFKNLQRLDQAATGLQTPLYVIGLAKLGYNVKGVIFNGAHTYRWKPELPTLGSIEDKLIREIEDGRREAYPTKKALRDVARAIQNLTPGVERPAAESFHREFLDHVDAQLDQNVRIYRSMIQRRAALRRGAEPIPNIGPLCRACPFKVECDARLMGWEQVEVEFPE